MITGGLSAMCRGRCRSRRVRSPSRSAVFVVAGEDGDPLSPLDHGRSQDRGASLEQVLAGSRLSRLCMTSMSTTRASVIIAEYVPVLRDPELGVSSEHVRPPCGLRESLVHGHVAVVVDDERQRSPVSDDRSGMGQERGAAMLDEDLVGVTDHPAVPRGAASRQAFGR